MQILAICCTVTLLAISSSAIATPSGNENSVDTESQVQSYAGYKVYTVTLQSQKEIKNFKEFKSTLYFVDTWKESRPNLERQSSNDGALAEYEYETNFMVPADLTTALETYLEAQGFQYTVMIEDVGALIEEEERVNKGRAISPAATTMTWDVYYTYDQIIEWFDEIVANSSDIATLSVIGNSTEGRAIKMVKISKPGSPPGKNAILIDGTFHAREWISPAVATYILNELLTNRTYNEEVLDAVDIYIVPIVNPDGYAFTHENSTNRMWRKTRSHHDPESTCYGVDPNRNFDFYFRGEGTSSNQCSEIYHGPTAFSEPEVRALSYVLLDKKINFVSYLTLHSYGQMWLTPWSYTDELPEDYDDLMKFANVGVDALKAVHGSDFIAGATTDVYGKTAGCADDWAKAVAGIKYSCTIEVRDNGTYGFLLPADLILPTAEETWAGIRAVTLFNFDGDSATTTPSSGAETRIPWMLVLSAIVLASMTPFL